MWAIKIICAVFLISLVVADSPPQEHPGYPERPGYCRIKDVYIKEGEEGGAPIGKCARIKCLSAEPGKLSILEVECGKYEPVKGCHLSGYDYTKRYPFCCPQSVCE